MKMRKFDWCRQEIAEECNWGSPHSHIVIASPGGRRILPACRQVTLRLFFYDLDPEAIRRSNAYLDDPAKGRELISGCFTSHHAEQIIAFVKLSDSDERIIVNCEAGVSRSPAVVLAFRRSQGEETESVFKKAHPNIHVASILGNLLGVGPFKAPKYEGIVDPFAE